MSLTWGEVLEDIRDNINERSDGFFSDTYILKQWNHAQLNFAREVRWKRKEQKINIQSDGTTIALPNDFMGLIGLGVERADGSVTFLTAVTMEGRSHGHLNNLSFYLVNNNMVKFTQAWNAESKAVINYYAQPEPLADETDIEQEVDLPDDYVDAVVQAVTARCLSRRLDYEYWQIVKREAEELKIQACINENRKMGVKRKQITK